MKNARAAANGSNWCMQCPTTTATFKKKQQQQQNECEITFELEKFPIFNHAT